MRRPRTQPTAPYWIGPVMLLDWLGSIATGRSGSAMVLCWLLARALCLSHPWLVKRILLRVKRLPFFPGESWISKTKGSSLCATLPSARVSVNLRVLVFQYSIRSTLLSLYISSNCSTLGIEKRTRISISNIEHDQGRYDKEDLTLRFASLS